MRTVKLINIFTKEEKTVPTYEMNRYRPEWVPSEIEGRKRQIPKPNVLDFIIAKTGANIGDLIEKSAIVLNNSGMAKINLNCQSCKQRNNILHAIDKIGKAKSAKLLWKSIRGNLTKEEEDEINNLYG